MSITPPPYIAILIPLYNGIEYFPQALASVISQTAPAELWELIIGINGHPPKSPVYQNASAAIASIVPANLRHQVRLIDFCDTAVPPKGKPQTLNLMVKLAHPMVKWIALLDADDIWLSTKLATQLPFTYSHIKTPAYDVIGTQCEYINAQGASMGIIPPIPLGYFTDDVAFKTANPIINSSAIIRRELAHWDTLWDGIEDYELWLRLHTQGSRFYNCPTPAVRHRIHASSAFNGTDGQKRKLDQLLTLTFNTPPMRRK